MKIRKATSKDIKQIDEIYVEGALRESKLQNSGMTIKELQKEMDKYKSSRPKSFLNEMKLKNHYWIVAEERGKIMGFGQAFMRNKDIGVLEKVYVGKNYLRKGVGSKILKELEKWIESKKPKYIEAGVYFKNKPSINLNKKFGYELISVKMRKKLR